MKTSSRVQCSDPPCLGVHRSGCLVPCVDIDPARVSAVLISEVAPEDPADYYYAGENALFAQTTVLAFRDAGAEVQSVQDILDLGFYLTTAVKCPKTGSSIPAATIEACSRLLEQEIALFPNAQVFLLMGDVAIKAINLIARRNGEPRVLPSYLQAGAAFFVEKSKRQMIAEDIRQALSLEGCIGVGPGRFHS